MYFFYVKACVVNDLYIYHFITSLNVNEYNYSSTHIPLILPMGARITSYTMNSHHTIWYAIFNTLKHQQYGCRGRRYTNDIYKCISSMKSIMITISWSLSLRAQQTICQHWFRWWYVFARFREVSRPRNSGLDFSTVKFDKYMGSSTAELPVKFQSDTIIIRSNLAASRLDEIVR